MRREGPPRGRFIAPRLAEAVQISLERSEQALLFLNRRGYAPLTLCRACGFRLQCPNCDAWLVDHRFRKRLVCHHCGFAMPPPENARTATPPKASRPIGPGVERLEQEAAELFPGARILVLSSDLVESIERLRAELDDVAQGPLRHRHRHAAGRQGPSFPQAQSGRHRRRRSRPRQRRSARRRAHLPTAASGGRPRRPRGGRGRRLFADASARASGDEGADLRRPRGVLLRARSRCARRTGYPPFGRLASLVITANDRHGAECYGRALVAARAQGRSGARARAGRSADRGGARPPSFPPAGEGAARFRSLGLFARNGWPPRPSRAAMCGWRSTSIRRVFSELIPASRSASRSAAAARRPRRRRSTRSRWCRARSAGHPA